MGWWVMDIVQFHNVGVSEGTARAQALPGGFQVRHAHVEEHQPNQLRGIEDGNEKCQIFLASCACV